MRLLKLTPHGLDHTRLLTGGTSPLCLHLRNHTGIAARNQITSAYMSLSGLINVVIWSVIRCPSYQSKTESVCLKEVSEMWFKEVFAEGDNEVPHLILIYMNLKHDTRQFSAKQVALL